MSAMEQEVLVTVLCTCFEQKDYLRDAVMGIVNQKTKFRFELLLHDDASKDGTREMAEDYARQYPDIICPILQTQNQYSRKVDIFREILFPRARGKYLAICEGDDYWTDENKLQKQVDFLENHGDYTACVHNTVRKDVISGKESLMYEGPERDLNFAELCRGGGTFFHTSSILCRAETLFHPVFEMPYVIFADYTIALQLSLAGKVHYLDSPMSVYRSNVAGSFTMRMKGASKHLIIVEKSLELLHTVLPLTKGEDSLALMEAIHACEYDGMELKQEYGEMQKPPYLKIFKAHPFLYRVKTRLKTLFPRSYRVFRRIKERLLGD